MGSIGNWSGLYKHRQGVMSKYPSVWDVPLVKKELDVLLPNIGDDSKVLEVGAGDRRFEAKIREKRPGFVYKSMDVDTATRQDYYDLSSVKEYFDVIFLFELIEHLSPEDGLAMLEKLRSLLSPGGKVIIGTPNLYHPHRYFGDITHRTPYKYEELGAVMSMAGFGGLEFYRVYNDAFFRRFLKLTLGKCLHRYLDIDFATSVIALGGIER